MNKYLLSRAYQLFVGELNLVLWKKLYLSSDHHYLRRKLLAIKYLYEGKSTKEVSRLVHCSEKKLFAMDRQFFDEWARRAYLFARKKNYRKNKKIEPVDYMKLL